MFKAILLFVALAVAFAFGFKKGMDYNDPEIRTKTINAEVLQQKLTQVSELASTKLDYTEVATHEKVEAVKVMGVKLGDSKSTIVVQYGGTIKAGVDLGKATFEVQDTVITFTLPQSQILSHEIDQNTLKVLNQDNGYFSSIKIDDFNAFCAEHKQKMEEEAIKNNLLKTAQEKAIESLSLITDPLASDGYTVIVKTASGDSINMTKEPVAPMVLDQTAAE